MTAPVGEARDALSVAEDLLKLAISLAVAVAAFYGSFNHMHEWTVSALHKATGLPDAELSWYGWANAAISELIPLAGLLSLRRRVAAGQKLNSYALWLVIAGGLLSIFAQIAWVAMSGNASPAALFLAVLPAFAALALVKLLSSDLDTIRTAQASARKAEEIRRAKADRSAEEIAAARAEAERARAEERKIRAEAEEIRQAEEAARLRAEEAEDRRVTAEAEAEAARASSGRMESQAEELRRRVIQHEDARRRQEGEAQALRAQLAARPTARRPRLTEEQLAMPNGDPVPVVEGVSQALTRAVLTAHAANPSGTQAEIAAQAETSDRTVRAVLKSVLTPSEA